MILMQLKYLDTNVNEYTESVLHYISGFVSKKLCRSIKCDLCVSLLVGEEKDNSLIFTKSRGGLLYASQEVLDIIKKTENLIKPHIKDKIKPETYYLYIFKFLVEYYSRELIFSTSDIQHNINHRLLLIKSIIKTYLDIRFRYNDSLISKKVAIRLYFFFFFKKRINIFYDVYDFIFPLVFL